MRHGAATRRISLQNEKGTQCAFIILPAAGGTPEQFGVFIKSEIAKYAKGVKAAGIHVE